MPIARFVYDPILKTLCRRTHSQETTTIGDIIENLLSRIVALEMRFETSPGDVEELRRRSDLIRHAIIPSSDLVLRFFQQVHGYRSRAAAVCQPCSSRRTSFWAPRRPTGDDLRLPGLFMIPQVAPSSVLTRTTDGTPMDDVWATVSTDGKYSPFVPKQV